MAEPLERARWQRLSAILDQAIELPPEARAAYAAEACGSDTVLRAEVLELLAQSGPPDDFLANPAAEQLAPLVASACIGTSVTLAGQLVGVYRLVRELGEGGMGVVYLAERVDGQFERSVAIKLLKQGVHAAVARRRFLAERQLLARLQHPSIACLLDGGVTRDGVPFFVMEYIEGSTITAFCRNGAADIDYRLRIFLDVCDAVEYAHQRSIVHRDLKPSNILVDNAGHVKLLDFGIAKLVNGAGGGPVEHTQTLARIMTPEHAAPEQIRGEPVTPSTDVYSLGVLLYELLTDERPYHIKTGSFGEVERAILEEEPTPPSLRLPKNANRRHIRIRLRGDLDRIVLKALEKAPARRYASAAALGTDVRRHLDGLPISVRNDLLHRARKFTHRHWIALSATAVALFIVVAGVAATSWQARRWRAARLPQHAATASRAIGVAPRRSVAVLEFQNVLGHPADAWLSTAISEMLSTELTAGGMLRLIPGEDVARMKRELRLANAGTLARDTAVRVGNNLKVDTLLVGSYTMAGSSTNRRMRVDLRLQDATSGEIVTEVAETGTERYVFELVSQAGARLRARLGVPGISPAEESSIRASVPANPTAARLYAEGIRRLRLLDAVAARDLLAQAAGLEPAFPFSHLALARAWRTLGYYETARSEAKSAFDLSPSLSRADRFLLEGNYRVMSNETDKAVEAYRALFALFPDSLEDGLLLAEAQARADRAADALATLEALRRLPAPSEDPRIDLLQGTIAEAQGNPAAQLAYAHRARDRARTSGAVMLLARAEASACYALKTLGQPNEAAEACKAAQRIFAEASDRSEEAHMLRFLGDIEWSQGRPAQANEMYRQVLKTDQALGHKGGMAATLNEMGLVFESQGDLRDAEKAYRRSFRTFVELGSRRNAVAVEGNLGGILVAEGKLNDAEKLFEHSLRLAREMGGKEFEGGVQVNLAVLSLMRGRLAAARQHADESVAARRQSGGVHDLGSSLAQLGAVLAAQGDLAGARQQHREALSIRKKAGETGTAAESRLALAELDLEEGTSAEAEGAIRDALGVFQQGKMRDDELEALVALSRCLLRQGKVPEAQDAIRQARQISARSQNPADRIRVSIVQARVKATRALKTSPTGGKSTRSYREARTDLLNNINSAHALGLVGLEYEARLILGELLTEADASARQAKDYLSSLEQDARARGLDRIARKAAALKESFTRSAA